MAVIFGQTFDDIMHKLKALTGLTRDAIIDTVQSLPCAYEYAAEFYATSGRFPTAAECRHVPRELIHSYHNTTKPSPGTGAGKEVEITEFCLIWFESAQKWVALFPTGELTDDNFGSVGYALNAALKRLGRSESEFDYAEGNTVLFYRFIKCDEFWNISAPGNVPGQH